MERKPKRLMDKPLPKYRIAKERFSLEEKVGQCFMPAAFINDTEEEIQKMEWLIQEHHIGSICFFHSRASAATNFEGKKKIVYNAKSLDRLKQLIERYQNAAKVPLLIAIDAEWGLAMRVEETPQYPHAITLGALQGEQDLIQHVGRNIGLDCRATGVHWNFAPVVDINNNPENPVIGYRSFGDDKNKVTQKAKAFIDGMKSTCVLNAMKHFPGHGDTDIDSHLGLPVIDKSMETLQKNELAPFTELMEADVDSVMVGHMSLPQVDDKNPSTTSFAIVTELLRNKLDFSGVIVSDALNMYAVSKLYTEKGKLEAAAFKAGMDVLCFSEHPKEGIENILKTCSEERIEASFERIWILKEKAFLTPNIEHHVQEYSATNLNRKIAEKCLTELYGSPNDIELLKRADTLNLAFTNNRENLFSKKITQEYGWPILDINSQQNVLETHWNDFNNAILALFPPAVKPKNKFGFDDNTLQMIHRLIQEKNVLIYLFGNPYVLDLLKLKSSSNMVIVYQDFDEFQEVAFEHFQGSISAKGNLPITLKTAQS